jgi:GNAT superfamily N-acetyltransferase
LNSAGETRKLNASAAAETEYHPLTKDRLVDLERFSEAHGKFRYCSCMRWRMTSADFAKSTKDHRVAALDQRVRQGTPVGVLAYRNGEPVGWCSVAPRESYAALERYRKLVPIDSRRTWAVVCFFVDARFRRKGMTEGLLRAAVEYARSQGARIVEGYPVRPGEIYGYMGSNATFERVGFREVTPAGRERSIFRLST